VNKSNFILIRNVAATSSSKKSQAVYHTYG
jgi:hypothetical protein